MNSEYEEITQNQILAWNLVKTAKEDFDKFIELAEFLPFFVHTNEAGNGNYLYANEALKTWFFDFFSDDYKTDTVKKYQRLSHKEVFNYWTQIQNNFYRNADYNSICTTNQLYFINNKSNWIIAYKLFLDEKTCLNLSHNVNNLGLVGKRIGDALGVISDNSANWQRFQSLTKREKEILKLVANGKTTQEISDIYSISTGTVRKHRENINRKIDARSIFDIIRFADGFGLIGAL